MGGATSEPDAPVLEFAGATPLSPRQIANAVAQMSEDGCNFVRMVEFGQSQTSSSRTWKRQLAGWY